MKIRLTNSISWYCHLQNDCKNIYSADYAIAKGSAAEDLRNGEFSYPIILALHHPKGDLVAQALRDRSERNISKAVHVLQSESIKGACLRELAEVGNEVKEFVKIWGRKENLDAKNAP